MDESIIINTLETDYLTAVRDTLLPKLISGKLRIPDAEKLLEAVLS
jgi:type I restriction enzyme S subunit